MNIPNHLYIHIPFCKNICAYCDFTRIKKENDSCVNTYIKKVIDEIKTINTSNLHSIYIGGGTPNILNIKQLTLLLKSINEKFDLSKTEFTIELNPELVTVEQCLILKRFGVNRASIGLQTTNDTILHKFNRHQSKKQVINTIKHLRKVKITNLSLDLMYGFNEMKIKDLRHATSFIRKYKIKHVSWYALEVKDGSFLFKQNYKLNDDVIETHLKYINNKMHKCHYTRYEVSNWVKDKKYESIHNKAYWLTRDWIGIGFGAFGLENKVYYKNVGNTHVWNKEKSIYNTHDYYLHILLMGLRLSDGLNLKNTTYKKAYEYFKDKLKYVSIKNNCLVCDNLNCLNETLVSLI